MASTILCVDDDPGFCRILQRAFREQGYRVIVAHDGDAAIEQIRSLRPQLVTLDVMLPRRDGFSVLEEIRRDERHPLPVVLLSSCRLSPDYRARAEALAADAALTKPVPLKRLLGLVAKLIPDAEDVSERPVRLSGSFEELPFAFLLHHLHGMRASGVLRVEHGTKKKLVQLRNGQPVAVRSNLVKETLGHLLVASGTITWDALHESVRRVKKGEGLQGQILKAMYMLDDEDLARALHQQAEQKLLEIFSWPSGRYRFQQGARIRGEARGLHRSPASLILEGVRERSTPVEVERLLRERHRLHPVRSSLPFHEFQSLEFDDEAEALLETLDGSRPLEEICREGDAQGRLLLGLIATGLVELEPHAPSRPPAVPRAHGRVAAERVRSVDRRSEGWQIEEIREELLELAARFEGEDPFAMFGLSPQAADAEIRRAYAELARRTHPDRFGAHGEAVRGLAEDVFSRVSKAYQAIATQADRQRAEAARRESAELEEGHQALRAELSYQRGRRALRARRWELALQEFGDAVKAYPEEGEYHAYFGWALHLAHADDPERLREAKRHALHGKKLAPDRSAPLLVLGRLCKAQGKTELAERLFTRAVELDPDCTEALQELRLIALRKRKNRSRNLVRRILRRRG